MTFLYMDNQGDMVEWPEHSFDKEAIDELVGFLDGKQVLPLLELVRSGSQDNCVYMRHDVDHSIDHAIKWATFEHSMGWQSSYFLLHSAWYWNRPDFKHKIATLKAMGHEIGIHNDAMCEAIRIKKTPAYVIAKASFNLKQLMGTEPKGVADHGGVGAVNGDLWKMYSPQTFGFEYEAYQLKNSMDSNYISDNQGKWQSPLEYIEGKVTHMLIHPCHWDIDGYTNG